MKKYLILLNVSILTFLSSCDKGEVFTGSPKDNGVVFETIVGTVVLKQQTIVRGQKIPITVTLPKSFEENVNIQATTFVPSINKRVVTSFILPAGQTMIETEVASPPGDTSILQYVMEAQVFLSAIGTDPQKPSVGFLGKQYLLTSNVAKFDFGSSTEVPDIASSRISIRLDYEFPNYNAVVPSNDLNLVLKKTNGTVTQLVAVSGLFSGTPSSTNDTRYDNVNISKLAPEDTYTLSIFARRLISTPTNLKYRFVIRRPNKSVETFTGTLNDLVVTNASQAIAKLKIVKTGTGDASNYEVTQI
jgi:hypothetical protein